MMPGMDGFELCRRVKQIADLPIIVLSAVDASEAKVSALELYAEDYITKPFDPDELVARIQRVLRRAPVGHPQISSTVARSRSTWRPGGCRRPPATHQLTPTEARLLQVLAASVDRVVPTEELLDRVWTDADGADPSYLWVTIRRLRRKLEADPDRPRYLITERGIGYRLSSGTAASRAGLGRAPHRALAARLRRASAGGPAADRPARRRAALTEGLLGAADATPRGRRRDPGRRRLGGDAGRRLHRGLADDVRSFLLARGARR